MNVLVCLSEQNDFDFLIQNQLNLLVFTKPTRNLAYDFVVISNKSAHKIRNALISFDIDYPITKTNRTNNYEKFKMLLTSN
jgi:glyoxylate carboligase